MIDREKLIVQRKKELLKIAKEQLRLTIKGAKLAGKVYKTFPAQMRNLGKVMIIMFQIRQLEIQKHITMSQPIRKREFPPGATTAGERFGPEMVMMPGDSQNCMIAPMCHIPVQNKKNDRSQFTK